MAPFLRYLAGAGCAGVALLTAPRALQSQSCSVPYFVEQKFPTALAEETRWRVCWQNTPQFGLRISSAHFRKSPNAPWMRVFWDARVSEIFVPYQTGSPRFSDLSQFNFPLATLSAADCPAIQGGTLLGPGSVVCKQVRPRGLAWRTNTPARRQGEELVLWGVLAAANYAYIMEWTFRDDGVVMGRLGATAVNLGWTPFEQHMHNAMWRLDIDFDGFWNDNVDVMSYSENLGTGVATLTDSPVTTEGFVDWDAAKYTMLHVYDPAVKNGNGKVSGYHMSAIRSGAGHHQEPWTQHDFWITRYNGTEMRPKDLPTWTNGQSVKNADIVVWYWGSILHVPRDEDGTLATGMFNGTAQVMWTGWMLKPHNLFDKVPLYP